MALAVDHPHAAQAVTHRDTQELGELLARLVAPQAVQVELPLDRPHAAPQLAHHLRPDPVAAPRQRVVGLQQRLDIELVGDCLAQHRGLVAFTLARQRLDPWSRQRHRRHTAQRHDRPNGVLEQVALAQFACSVGTCFSLAPRRLGSGLRQRLLQCGQVVQAAHAARRRHSRPRSANEIAWSPPTTR